jgi:hypothetical protein
MMNLKSEGLRQAVELAQEAAGVEAAMIAQFTVDLAITVAFTGAIPKQKAKDLYRQRLERQRAKLSPASREWIVGI